ncbi:hypothetical protein [Flavobacterium limnophilum]|uniref:hypothetical protein n=1 Tax=Flavobacterium limnophilum TaxID=3003262 RepID=UPI0022AC46F5|nr:hypothetical protein [Flavobacterium limnophilum]
MNLTLTVKQLGKKQPLLKENILNLNTTDSIITVRSLIELVVEHQIKLFNAASFEWDDEDQIHLPKENYLPLLTDTGKLGFGALYNHNKIDSLVAQQNAILAFEDGLYAVFYGDDELNDLSLSIDLSLNKTLTFIRLTFLAGSYW